MIGHPGYRSLRMQMNNVRLPFLQFSQKSVMMYQIDPHIRIEDGFRRPDKIVVSLPAGMHVVGQGQHLDLISPLPQAFRQSDDHICHTAGLVNKAV